MIRLIKNFLFRNFERDNIELSHQAKIRLVPHKNVIELRENSAGQFPMDTDIFVKTPLFSPAAIKSWLNFDAEVLTPNETNIKYRLGDGEKDYFWNGDEWESGNGWNTLIDVNHHISKFPSEQKKIQVLANLTTVDPECTPTLFEIKILFELNIMFNFQQDIMVSSLIPLLASVEKGITVTTLASENYVDKLELPVILLKNIHFTNELEGNISEFIVTSRIEGKTTTLEIPPPKIADIEFDIIIITDNSRQDVNTNISEKIYTLLCNENFLISKGLDQKYPLQLSRGFSTVLHNRNIENTRNFFNIFQNRQDNTEQFESRAGRARIQGVQFYLKEPIERTMGKHAQIILKKQAI